MIVGVGSLAEAIEHVTDADVKEELQYQYEYHIKPLLGKADKADEYKETAEELQEEVKSLKCRLEELT